jgi:peptidoglycan/xylan/chitin deacetylase (PgdA/CDA1 family)
VEPRRLVSLTFDNGPTPVVTDRVLAVLAERGVPATFFVVGERVEGPAGRALRVKRVRAEAGKEAAEMFAARVGLAPGGRLESGA